MTGSPSPSVKLKLRKLLICGSQRIAILMQKLIIKLFTKCNVQQLFHVRPKVTGKHMIRDIWGISDLDGEKDFNDDHREEITDFVQSIPRLQECAKEDVKTWMLSDAED
ncbi:uncharacterized protein TNCV_2278941 [Trichonephila clavipes]|uniref:Uncharacterized protein n=1 Tax=Trichonephila clavipes TaxID=2585209 RepID=A0A8X6UQG3_TRICX|nr:uncharacterized protein TNCV_2278941 [Trichonephila clavipes]